MPGAGEFLVATDMVRLESPIMLASTWRYRGEEIDWSSNDVATAVGFNFFQISFFIFPQINLLTL